MPGSPCSGASLNPPGFGLWRRPALELLPAWAALRRGLVACAITRCNGCEVVPLEEYLGLSCDSKKLVSLYECRARAGAASRELSLSLSVDLA